ncbi:MAG: helix-turn-helix domain-containing protein [Actinomycetia bacterium]|nr:helix-turn-helix domain-containing protein [Actinomycetes bacterium]
MARRIATVIAEGGSLFELGAAVEVFGIDRSDLTSDWYQFRLCGAGPRPVRTETGITVDTPFGLEALEWADTIVVLPTARRDVPEDYLTALRTAHQRGTRLISICTGAFVLAAAGLLDDRRATTHWAMADELAARYPLIEVDPNVLYVDHGDIATSAGAAAGIDLCLHIVRLDHGAEVANLIARRLVVPPHREGGQAQYIEYPMVSADDADVRLDEALDWARENLSDPITVDQLAHRAAMSPRTLARRFRDATGTTPHQWLIIERVRLAQRLLETTDRSIDWIANDAGFGTTTNMRQHFQRMLTTSPGRYRATFRQNHAD